MLPPNDFAKLSVPVPTADPDKPDYIVETHQRRFKIRSFPNIKYNQGIQSFTTFFVSRASTVNALHSAICEKLAKSSKDKLMSAHMLKGLSRLWRFGTSDDFESIQDSMKAISNDYNQLPIDVHGTLLDPDSFIEDINVADDELIMFEWRIVFDPKDEGGWAFNPGAVKKTKIKGFKSHLNEKF